MISVFIVLVLLFVDLLPECMVKYFVLCDDKLGFVSNVLCAYVFDVVKLDAFMAMYNDLMLGDSGLTKLECEMIAVVVSLVNCCWYCQVAYGAVVWALLGDLVLGEVMVMNWRVAFLLLCHRVMLDFVVKVT